MKESEMNAKQIIVAIAVVTAAGAAAAIEATQFDDTPSTKTREEVKAELEQAKLDGTLMSGGEATVFVDRPVAAATRSREDVREEARMAARAHAFDEQYVGAI
jgi:hypothetical protein